MAMKPAVIEKPARRGANSILWSSKPLLGNLSGRNYKGRVFLEVWENDHRLVVVGGNTSLIERAASTLQGQFDPVRQSLIPFTSVPATGEVSDQKFLGRLTIEVWDDHTVVGINGSDPRIVERALQTLSSAHYAAQK